MSITGYQKGKTAGATVTSVNSAATSTSIIAANRYRSGVTVTNTDANTLYLLVGGGTASATNYSVPIAAGAHWEAPYGFTGAITGIWSGDGAGAALVTEYV